MGARADRPGRAAFAASLVCLLACLSPAGASALPDGRGYELVSPVEKNGAQVDLPETLFGGGDFQAAAQGGALTYSAAASFADPLGSPGASQYLARRGAVGWATENLTVTQFSGGFDTSPGAGAPYRLFSSDLDLGLLTNGRRCRGEGTECPVPNPSLPGSGAPTGYRNFYLRDNVDGSYMALLSSGDLAVSALGPEDFEVDFAAATPDLAQIVLSTCAALTADAIEEPGTGGECDPAAQNLYLHSSSGLRLINVLPGDSEGTPGAHIAAQSGAISTDGSRVYFSEGEDGALYLREGDGPTKLVPETVGGGASFQAASADGAIAFFTRGGGLYRYDAQAGTTKLLAAGVVGALGVPADASSIYYLAASGLFRWQEGTTTKIAAGADASNYPPATGTARLSADGGDLAFLSAANLTGFDSKGKTEVYRYSAADGLRCVSCNSTGTAPLGSAAIPGAIANGDSFKAYKPRALSADGNRLFFESRDALVAGDTNGDRDVYQWEAQGTGSCADAAGCVELISTGRAEDGGRFIDASADGSDVFFATDGSLVAADPGGLDLYDARIGGGFPVPLPPIPCIGDACQPLPGEPEDPTPGTLLQTAGNERLRIPKGKHHKKKHKHKKKHRRRAR